MEVQIKRAFKSYFFVTKNLIKERTGSVWNFLQSPILVCRGAYIPYFKISAPIFCCPFFSENYLNPQARINKMVNKHTVDYHPSPSELISRITPSYFYGLQRGLSRQNPCWIFSETCIFHHGCGKVSNLCCYDYWQIHLWVKKLNLFIFTHVLKQNSPLGFHRKLPILPEQRFGFCFVVP